MTTSTSTQPDLLSLLDLALAERDWRSLAMTGVRTLAASGEVFEISDVRTLGVPEPPSTAMWGALARLAIKERVIRCVGTGPSRVPSRRRALTRHYVGRAARIEAAPVR